MKFYVSIDELLKTDTGLSNKVSAHDVRDHLVALRIVLSVLRLLLRQPLYINSGYRSDEVNKAVGGSPNSYHLYGCAADIRCEDMGRLRQLCTSWHSCGIFRECIDHQTYIHVAI